LRAAGVAVEMAEPDIAATARDINIGFFSRVERGRPWVRVKVACSLDGRTALPDGSSQWITGPQARADGHAWRRRAAAVLTGTGTVLADNPRLDVRLVPTPAQPLRVIVDSRLSTPPNARILAAPGKVLIATTQPDAAAAAALRDQGAEVVGVAASNGMVDLRALLHLLARRDVNEVHVEAGPTLNGSLVREGLIDELLVYQAPVLLGEGRPMAALGLLQQLAQAPRFEICEASLLAGDLRLRARLARG
jgi:diaminohydroxyphosphoribosylaminopyrimidine deaminase/5-amino-6-(5-phosphoribosylamino)uracil reductase